MFFPSTCAGMPSSSPIGDRLRCVFSAAAMGKSVRELLRSIAEQVGGLTPERSQDYLKRMQSAGRFVAELWS